MNTFIQVWNVQTGEPLRDFEAHNHGIMSVMFSPDGSRVAAVSGSKACVWDVLSGRELCRFDSPNLGRLAWSPSGLHLAIGGEVWDAATGRRIDANDSVATGRLPRMGTAFSRDGRLLAVTEDMTTVSLWDAATGKHLKRLQMEDGPNYWPCCVTFSRDDSQLVIGTGTERFPVPGKLQVWDRDSGTVVMNLDGFLDSIASLALSPDGPQSGIRLRVKE